MMRRLFLVVWLMASAMPALGFQPPAAQSEYVPVKDLPPVDQLPAAPLLVAAYSLAPAADDRGSLHLHPGGVADWHRDRVGARVASG